MVPRLRLLLTATLIALPACGTEDKPSSSTGGSAGSGGNSGSGGASGSAGSGSGGVGGSSGGVGGSSGMTTCPEGPSGPKPSDYLSQFGSGSRLKARFAKAQGAPPVFEGFFDTKLSVACDFRVASDDKLRCLPREAIVNLQLGFADAACTEPVYNAEPACLTKTGYRLKRLECLDKYSVHPLVKHVSGMAEYGGSPQNCKANSKTTIYPNAAIRGAEISPDTFVAGTTKDLPAVCKATLRTVQSQDGAFGPLALLDVKSKAACRPGEGACKPARLAHAEPMFADSACTKPVTYATSLNAPSCAPPDFIRPAGGTPNFYHTVGAPVSKPVYASPCELALNKPWIQSVYELGTTKVPLQEFAQFAASTQGSGRLQAQIYQEDSSPLTTRTRHGVFFDSQLKVSCDPRLFDDKKRRCMPTDALVDRPSFEFNDANCTERLFSCSLGAQCAGAVVSYEATSPGECTTERQLSKTWRLTSKATGNYGKVGANCVSQGAPLSDRWRANAVSTSEFPEVTLETAK